MSEISKSLNQAIFKSVLGKYSLYVFQLVSLAVLSRIYTPDMFGVLAAVTVMILFFQLLATSGLGPAIVHCDTITPSQRDGIFSSTAIIGIVGALLFMFMTPSLIKWLELSDIPYISIVLAFNIFFSALSMFPLASLQKDTEFLLIARAEIFAELSSFLVALSLYYLGFGILGLISKLLVVPIARFFLYFYFSKSSELGRPWFGAELIAIKRLFGVAKYQLAFNVLNFFSRNLDTILITKYFGAPAVGIYEKSYQVMRYPLQLFTFAITPALQPILTKHKHNPELVMGEFYRVAFKLVMLGTFVALVLFWAADDVVLILFGPQWHGTAAILQILSITIPLQMVLSSTGGVFQAFGSTKEMFYCGLFSSVTNISAIVLGVVSGDLLYLCLLLTCSFLMNFIQCIFVLHRYVFKLLPIRQVFLLLSLIIFSYLNLLFKDTEVVENLEYSKAFINSAIVSVIAISLVSTIYFIISKFDLFEIKSFKKDLQ
ncbi:MAG: O-antigen/teichoic acid export membrane protein [Pseudoalteromonas tetraodonis]|jgi:O-antigen/teichoic acid export membrane protein